MAENGNILKNVHSLLIERKANVPEDFNEFEATMRDKPDVQANVHQFLVDQGNTNVPTDFNEFTTKLGLKKKRLRCRWPFRNPFFYE